MPSSPVPEEGGEGHLHVGPGSPPFVPAPKTEVVVTRDLPDFCGRTIFCDLYDLLYLIYGEINVYP